MERNGERGEEGGKWRPGSGEGGMDMDMEKKGGKEVERECGEFSAFRYSTLSGEVKCVSKSPVGK